MLSVFFSLPSGLISIIILRKAWNHLRLTLTFPTEEEVPGYQLPYKEEAGPNPSLERLKDIVVTRKLRPSLPAIWGNHEVSCVAAMSAVFL